MWLALMSIINILHRGRIRPDRDNSRDSLLNIPHNIRNIEIDIRVTKDLIPVLHHDKYVKSDNTKVRISRSSFSDLQAYCQTSQTPELLPLEEAFYTLRHKKLQTLFLDIKVTNRDYIAAIIQTVIDAKINLNSVVFLSKYPQTIRVLRERSDTARLGLLRIDKINIKDKVSGTLDLNVEFGFIRNGERRFVENLSIIQQLRTHFQFVGASAINSPSCYEQLKLLKIDHNITDNHTFF
jgi:glycerophosphoryl diester phosphodiesterase